MITQRTVIDLLPAKQRAGCSVCINVCAVHSPITQPGTLSFDQIHIDESMLVAGFRSMLSQEPAMRGILGYISPHIRERSALAVDVLRLFSGGGARRCS
jgi:hypothetical protein